MQYARARGREVQVTNREDVRVAARARDGAYIEVARAEVVVGDALRSHGRSQITSKNEGAEATHAALLAQMHRVVKAGGEGLVLHRGASLYTAARNDDLLKVNDDRVLTKPRCALRLIAIKKIAYNPITTGARGIKRSKGCRQWRWPVEHLWCRLCRGNCTCPENYAARKNTF